LFLFATVLFFSAILLLLFSANMQKSLDHDEHQFVASGALLAREGRLPYLNYAYFHMPNLTFLYAGLFAGSDHLLLAARTFATVCAWLSLGLIFWLALGLFPRVHPLLQWLIAASGVLLLVVNPVFVYTSGKAWNHDLSVLFALLAFVLHSQGARTKNPKRWVFFSGLCVGLAFGTRLSFAPVILPFLGMILLFPEQARRQRLLVLPLTFGLGLLLALLPSLILFALAPKPFVFGNLDYARYNTLYRQKMGFVEGDVSRIAMTFGGKLSYLARYVIAAPGNVLLILGFLFLAVSMNVARIRHKPPHWFETVFLWALIPFLLMGSLAPTPSFLQYFYAPVPFLVLGVLYGIASFRDCPSKLKWSLVLLANVVFIAGAYGVKSYQAIDKLLSLDEWLPIQVHKAGNEIGAAVGDGQILTLAPIFPLEGRVRTYEEFATGSFAWRISPLVPEADRKKVDLVSDADLNDFLGAQPPAAILTGYERALEQPFTYYAQDNGYQRVDLTNGTTLWLRR